MKAQHLLSILVLGLILSSSGFAQGWDMYAISGDVVSGKTFILLTWPRDNAVAGFNLYRKESVTEPYPRIPVNGQPLSVMTDCDDIKAIIPPASEEWKAISKTLATPEAKTKKQIKPRTPIVPPKKSIRLLPKGYIPFDPCTIASIPDTSQAYERLQSLAYVYWKIGVVIGQAYADSAVTVGKTYWYEIRGVNNTGVEIGVLDTDVQVTAGITSPLQVPPRFSAEPGDFKVQITWDDVAGAAGYDITRETLAASPIKINESTIIVKCIQNLEGDTIPETNCFIDAMHWDTVGNPEKHVVEGDSIYGPYNGTTYRYKIRARDILGRPGSWSGLDDATPQDQTPPAVPADIRVIPRLDGLEVQWFKVTHDIEGHRELQGIKGYHVYRFESPDTLDDSIQVATLIPHPSATEVQFVSYKDTDPTLRSEYGEKDYWYRVVSIDNADNVSPLSPAAGDHLPDTTPPTPPRNLDATGFADHIALEWRKPNPIPPDLAGYIIYRGVCGHDSVWHPKYEKYIYTIYPLHNVGNIDNPDTTQYDDYTVPLDAPICYRYAVKAYDQSQNLGDTSNTICERLREETPPPPPIISSLKARDLAIKVEWVSAPVQDLFGFIVERADTVSGPWKRVSDSLIFDTAFGCEDIPATNIWAADTTFSFLDKTVEPKKIYWYRVRGADYGGNIGDPSVPIETYTFDFSKPPQPTDLSVNQAPGECALRITWNPPYDTTYLGFAVFRSSFPDQGYRQISPIVQSNEFIDNKIMEGKEYWYKVQYFGKDGNRSTVPDPESAMTTP